MDVGRLSRQFGRSRSGFLEGRALCSWFGCLFLGLCFYGDAFRYYLGPVRRPARLATFLEAGLARVRAFPRFDVVFLRADVRCFRLAISVSH